MFSEASKVACVQWFQSQVKLIPPHFWCFLTVIATATTSINYYSYYIRREISGSYKYYRLPHVQTWKWLLHQERWINSMVLVLPLCLLCCNLFFLLDLILHQILKLLVLLDWL